MSKLTQQEIETDDARYIADMFAHYTPNTWDTTRRFIVGTHKTPVRGVDSYEKN